MKKSFKIVLTVVLAAAFSLSGLAGCKNGNYNNESTPFVIASEEMDGMFNPFFYTSDFDRKVTGNTSIALLSADKDGKVVAGSDVPSVAEAYKVGEPQGAPVTNPTDKDNYTTEYQFLIKNNVVFSDGTPLTIDDILFNLYVYLDPVYTGSATIYSTNIRGLKKYRNQSETESDVDGYANINAQARLQEIKNWITVKGQWPQKSENPVTDQQKKDTQLALDIEKIEELFREELTTDWSNAQNRVSEYEKLGVTEGWQVFLITSGIVTIKEENGQEVLDLSRFNSFAGKTSKEEMINEVYDSFLNRSVNLNIYQGRLEEVVLYWGTGSKAVIEFASDEKSKYFEELRGEDGNLKVKTIEGITVERNATVFDGKTIEGGAKSILKIKINGIDPKAIYNFGFPIAPRKYYSTAAALAAQDANPAENFGVEFASVNFMNKVIKSRKVPIGAGPYKVTSKMNKEDETTVSYDEFFEGNVCYLQRNEKFMMGSPKIKYLRYQVVNRKNVFDSIKQGTVFYADADATADTIKKVDKAKNVKYITAPNPGYGYIGINPKYIKDINLRKAIMYAMDVSRCLTYYTNDLAYTIYRPMSDTNWAYPKGSTAKYPYDSTGDKTKQFLRDAKYTWNEKNECIGLDGKRLKLTFTIASSQDDDHPALATFNKAEEILEKLGVDVVIKKDANALQKLASGSLEVWAAAWSSTIDPDMYQVYHKDSNATSVLNWGYPEILYSKDSAYTTEASIIDQLSKLIDDGRTTNDENLRKEIYKNALDLVMDLAIELPTYQRKNMFIYNNKAINEKTMTPSNSITAYNGPIDEIWKLSYKGN